MARITASHVRSVVGDIDDTALASIVATGASVEEFEEAYAWAQGESDVVGETERPLAGRVRQIYEILVANEQWYEDE